MLNLTVIGEILIQRRVSALSQWYPDSKEDVGQLFHTDIGGGGGYRENN